MRVADGEPKLPERVQNATSEYEKEQDQLGNFIAEECEIHEYLRVGKTEFHRACEKWSNGKCESRKALSPKMKQRGFKDGTTQGTKSAWRGIGLSANNLQDVG